MRTCILVLIVALFVAIAMGFVVGLFGITTEQSDGRYVVSLMVNTAMINNVSTSRPESRSPDSLDDVIDVKGKVTAVRPEKNEFVVSENVKNWTFQLAKDGKVLINDREAKLAEMQAGDEAVVTFNRQGDQLLANVVRCTRK